MFLRTGWAMVVFGKVWIGHEATWSKYQANDFWRAHEHHHIKQEREQFSNSISYVLAFLWQYARYRGHEKAPLEREADEAAKRELASRSNIEA